MYRSALILVAALILMTVVATYAYAIDNVRVLKYKVGIKSYAVIEMDGKRMVLRGHRAEELLKKLGIIQEKPKIEPYIKVPKHTVIEQNTDQTITVADNNATVSITNVPAKRNVPQRVMTRPTIPQVQANPQPKTQNSNDDRLARIEHKLDIIISLLRAIAKALGVRV